MTREEVRIATFPSRIEAEVARAALASRGIAAHLQSDDAGGAYPQLQAAGVHLLVQAGDAETAAELLSQDTPSAEGLAGDLAAAEEAVHGRQPSPIGGLGPSLLNALLLLSLGAVAGFILSGSEALESRENVFLYTDAMEVDRNRDGRIDAWYVFRGPDLTRSRIDRNFDEKPDYWDFHRDGLIVRSELDDDFDGEVDGWLSYQHGFLSTASFDTDHNGVPDSTTEHRHGIPTRTRLHPNGGPVEGQEIFVEGTLREVYSVDPDGSRTLIRSYDPLGRELDSAR